MLVQSLIVAALALPVELAEVGVDGLQGERIVVVPHDLPARLGELLQFRWGGPIGIGEDQYLAVLRGSPTLAVAPARGLGDGVQARLGPQHSREVDVHAGLYQGGGYQAAGRTGPKALPDRG